MLFDQNVAFMVLKSANTILSERHSTTKNLILILLSISHAYSQDVRIDKTKIRENLNEIINDLSQQYVYLQEKNVDLTCLREYYDNKIEYIKTEEETVLFFEYLLDEFYDNHLTLRTNRNSSFRLFAPIYVTIVDSKPIVTNVWQTQIENLGENIIGAEILQFNGIDFKKVVADFPTHCNDKNEKKQRNGLRIKY